MKTYTKKEIVEEMEQTIKLMELHYQEANRKQGLHPAVIGKKIGRLNAALSLLKGEQAEPARQAAIF